MNFDEYICNIFNNKSSGIVFNTVKEPIPVQLECTQHYSMTAENCCFPGLKTLILLRFMPFQLFARYSKLAIYVSAVPILTGYDCLFNFSDLEAFFCKF